MCCEREFLSNFLFNCVCGEGEKEPVVLDPDGAVLVLNMLFDGKKARRQRWDMKHIVEANREVVEGDGDCSDTMNPCPGGTIRKEDMLYFSSGWPRVIRIKGRFVVGHVGEGPTVQDKFKFVCVVLLYSRL